jgi:uncharacterized SAM-binding protein YcdF (DUF218 family)
MGKSLSSLAPVLRQNNISSVLVSTDRWHMQRCVLSLRDLGVRSNAVCDMPRAHCRERNVPGANMLKETVGVGLGRIIGFDRLLSITG